MNRDKMLEAMMKAVTDAVVDVKRGRNPGESVSSD